MSAAATTAGSRTGGSGSGNNSTAPPEGGFLQLTSLADQAYRWSQYRIRDSVSGHPISGISAILLSWSQKLKSRAVSEADRKYAELLTSDAKGIAVDPHGDSWEPFIRHFSAAGSEIPPDELSSIKHDLGVWEEIRPPTDEQEIDEDYAEEDAFVASLSAEEIASQVIGEPVLTDEQRNKLLGL